MSGRRLVVWYNMGCPACSRRAARNKLIAAVRADHIMFKDVDEEPDALAPYGASLDDVRRRLHR
jgi:predicted DCC family thiol-disulfide oxidoreductase YuxK